MKIGKHGPWVLVMIVSLSALVISWMSFYRRVHEPHQSATNARNASVSAAQHQLSDHLTRETIFTHGVQVDLLITMARNSEALEPKSARESYTVYGYGSVLLTRDQYSELVLIDQVMEAFFRGAGATCRDAQGRGYVFYVLPNPDVDGVHGTRCYASNGEEITPAVAQAYMLPGEDCVHRHNNPTLDYPPECVIHGNHIPDPIACRQVSGSSTPSPL